MDDSITMKEKPFEPAETQIDQSNPLNQEVDPEKGNA